MKNFPVSIIAVIISGAAAGSIWLLYRSAGSHETSPNTEIMEIINGNLKNSARKDNRGTSVRTAGTLIDLRNMLSRILRRITADTTTLDMTADELVIIADDTKKSSDHLEREAKSMAETCGTMSGNIISMASAADELSGSAQSVAQAIEQLADSINEVASNSSQGASLTHEVSQKAAEAEKIISQMGLATDQITSIVTIIQKIATKTNLLALNATIEAASAGESGRGFAVVATEVKELANQSLTASEQIAQQVQHVQQSAQMAISAIQQVFAAIGQISSVSRTIASAVEEQSSTTTEVSRSISRVSSRLVEFAHNIQQASSASEDVAKRSVLLEDVARKTSVISSQTRIGVDSINDIRKDMASVVEGYRLDDARFDILKVKSAHMNWVRRLQAVLRGDLQLHPDEVTPHTACEFGKWFYSEHGKLLSGIPAYAEVGDFHEQVHLHAREVVRLYNSKAYTEAQDTMIRFEVARNRLFNALNALYQS